MSTTFEEKIVKLILTVGAYVALAGLVAGFILAFPSTVLAQETTDLSATVQSNSTKVAGVKGQVDSMDTTISALVVQADDNSTRLAAAEQLLIEQATRLAVLEAGSGGGTDPGGVNDLVVPQSCILNVQYPFQGMGSQFFQDQAGDWYRWDAFTRFYVDTTANAVRANGGAGTVNLARNFLSSLEAKTCLNDILSML